MLNSAQRHEDIVRGSGYTVSTIINLVIGWRRAVSFMRLPLYPRERTPDTC